MEDHIELAPGEISWKERLRSEIRAANDEADRQYRRKVIEVLIDRYPDKGMVTMSPADTRALRAALQVI